MLEAFYKAIQDERSPYNNATKVNTLLYWKSGEIIDKNGNCISMQYFHTNNMLTPVFAKMLATTDQLLKELQMKRP